MSALLGAPIGCQDCSGTEVRSEFLVFESKRKLKFKTTKLLNGWGKYPCIVRGVAQGERTGS